MVNKDNTLTVAWLLKAVADGRVTVDMPIGILLHGDDKLVGVCAAELYTYKDGQKVFVIHTETSERPLATELGEYAAEVGLT